jgi:ubiquinone/menaquinone biosynthesis C-methylase UbiE
MYFTMRLRSSTPEHWESQLGLLTGKQTLNDFNLMRFAHNRNRDPLWKEIKTRIPKGKKILDAGCGMGQWVWFLNKQGYKTVGLDYSERMVGFLESRFPDLSWSVGAIQNIPFKDCEFDHLISWGVIEHDSEGPGKALLEFHRVMRSGGILFVCVPIDTYLQRKSHEVQYPRNIPGAVFYEYFYTADEFRSLLLSHKFRVISIYPVCPHYAVLWPKQYMRILRNPKFPNNVVSRTLSFLAKLRQESRCMLFAVAEKI